MKLVLSGKFDGTPWLLSATELADNEGFSPYGHQGKEDSERKRLNTQVLAFGRELGIRVFNRVVTKEVTAWEFFTEYHSNVFRFAVAMAEHFDTELIVADELMALLREGAELKRKEDTTRPGNVQTHASNEKKGNPMSNEIINNEITDTELDDAYAEVVAMRTNECRFGPTVNIGIAEEIDIEPMPRGGQT